MDHRQNQERKEEREQARLATAAKLQRRIEIRNTVDDALDDLASTPSSDFPRPTSSHNCFLDRSSILLRNVLSGREYRGETDSYITFLRENRDSHHKDGVMDFYVATRIMGTHAGHLRDFFTDAKLFSRGSDGGRPVEFEGLTQVENKLEHIEKSLISEQGMALKIVRREMSESVGQ